MSSIRDADRVVSLLAAADVPARLVVSRISANLIKRGDMLSQADVIEILALEAPRRDPASTIRSSRRPTRASRRCSRAKSVAAHEFIRIAKRLAGHEVADAQSVGFFTRIGRALGLSTTPR